jgi:CoA:oxalate CoA-transferase
LADLGAEVIKIEVPSHGDDTRGLGPFRNGESLYFSILNRRKKSVTLNLKDDEARRIFLELASKSHVVLENFRPGVVERLGIGYPAVAQVNSRIVYASISGFGQTGPLALLPAYDLIIQAASGLMSLTGEPDGPPMKVGESIADLSAGVFGAFAIATALYDVSRTGQGAHLDVSMLECLLSLEVTAQSQYDVTGTPPQRVGNRHPISTPFGAYAAKDGFVILAAANDQLFANVAALIERDDMVGDSRFSSDTLRTQHEPEVREAIESWTSQRLVSEVVLAAGRMGVPASPISDLGEALESEQVGARGALRTFVHPRAGSVAYIGQPVHFSSHERAEPVTSPDLGADTEVVLTEVLGLSAERIASLHERGVL